jgi:hypothetical protein
MANIVFDFNSPSAVFFSVFGAGFAIGRRMDCSSIVLRPDRGAQVLCELSPTRIRRVEEGQTTAAHSKRWDEEKEEFGSN